MPTMDAAWLRERAERIAASGAPGANDRAAALWEAADDLEAAAAASATDTPP
jgi:hypothetical protein